VRAKLEGRAVHEATLRQVDTYFVVPTGRLKLREVEGRRAQLVYYERPDLPDVKASRVLLANIEDGSGLRALLSAALGVKATVAKSREIWRWEGVQVHLDTVEDLGSFVEFEEVVAKSQDLPQAQAHLRRLLGELGIRPEALVATSYGDLVAGP
jgi:predicted adenylyl cyclase CyaB